MCSTNWPTLAIEINLIDIETLNPSFVDRLLEFFENRKNVNDPSNPPDCFFVVLVGACDFFWSRLKRLEYEKERQQTGPASEGDL